jgi:hypothetical protein
MNKKIKQQIFKIFYIVSFLFITIFFILPYLIQISTYFHETSHVNALENEGVESSYSFNLLDTIPNFFNPNIDKLGVTKFDLNAYNQLDKFQRAEANIAGIVSDLRFLFLIGVYLSLVNVYLFYRVKIKKNYNLTWVLAIDWILFMWLLALVQITVANITFSSGDVYNLINGLKV